LSAVQWSSFEGMEFTVRVAATYCGGKQVFDGARILNQKGDGRFLRPASPSSSVSSASSASSASLNRAGTLPAVS